MPSTHPLFAEGEPLPSYELIIHDARGSSSLTILSEFLLTIAKLGIVVYLRFGLFRFIALLVFIFG